MRAARTRRNGVWVDYKWAHPLTNQVLTKSTYVEQVEDLFVACGIYKTSHSAVAARLPGPSGVRANSA